MLITIFLIIIFTQLNQADDYDDFIIPVPKFHSSEPDLRKMDGCTYKIYKNNTLICTECANFKVPKDMQPEILKVKTSKITVFRQNDFKNFTRLKTLEIQFNLELKRFEPGCFKSLNILKNLSISINHNLCYLEENVFEGLINLQELYLFKNGFTKIYDITRSIQVKYVPNLLKLSLNENVFKNVQKNDFVPMMGTKLSSLEIMLCQIDYIDYQSFNPLKNLTELWLGQNLVNVTTLEKLMIEIIDKKIPLKSLSLSESGFRRNPPYELLQYISKTNITNLSLAKNMFDNINSKSFPHMANIINLDLSDCLLLDVAINTFDSLPNLKSLILKENRLPCITPGMTLNNLQVFDISGNSGNQISRSYFRIDDYVFTNMSKLYKLMLDYNLVTQITCYTFIGLLNLRYLSLKNATVFNLENGAFKHLKKLLYLNMENNRFTVILKPDMFKGMNELKVLLLGGCSIEHLTNPSPFEYLYNLTYLGLQSNSLYSLNADHFLYLTNLKSLDLSGNKLIEWDQKFINPSTLNLDISQNKIKTITEIMIQDFSNLISLNLENNPFTCDCLLKTLLSSNYSNLRKSLTAKCVNPDEWSQQSIIDYLNYLHTSDDCMESTINTKLIWITTLSIFGVLLTTCTIVGYVYRLHLTHWLLLTRMFLRRVRKKKMNTKYHYDAFVSYSNEDQAFVIQMVKELENNPPHFKLCVYERDFQIGTAISESVLQSVANSRRTILVVSDAFAKSQWCRWEAKLAEHHQLFFYNENSHGTLLIILLGKVSEQNMTPTLKYLLKTRIYLQWNEKQEKLFWQKLRRKLTAPNLATYESRHD